MPIIVWYAVVFAIILISGTSSYAIFKMPTAFTETINGPTGIILASGIVAVAIIVTCYKLRPKNKDDKQ